MNPSERMPAAAINTTMTSNLQDLSFDLASLRAAYAAGTPVRAIIAEAMRRCATDENHAFIQDRKSVV